jgi:hypothetical protein
LEVSVIRFLGSLVSRVIGVVLLLIGVVGIGLATAGAVIGRRGIGQVTEGLGQTLLVTSESLGTVEATLLQTKETLSGVNELVDTAGGAAVNLSGTIEATGQSVDQVSQIAAADLPAILEALEAVVGELARTAEGMSSALDALRLLTRGLMDFTAGAPDPEPARELAASIGSMASEVQGLAEQLDQVTDSVEPISNDAVTLAENLATINETLRGFAPIVDQYVQMIKNVRYQLDYTRASLPRLVWYAKLAITITMAWAGALHVAPLYVGWELMTRERERKAAARQEEESAAREEEEPAAPGEAEAAAEQADEPPAEQVDEQETRQEGESDAQPEDEPTGDD